ncbi:MAG TPA: TatD family hydrolase [Acidimicrobiia bacterium]|nr:TatD family hydrolase [Acidimicrobiia bacterium]
MTWVDTHCHLQLDGRSPGTLLERADHVGWLVVPGVDADSSVAARELARSHPDRLRWSAGLHPHDAEHWAVQSRQIMELAEAADAVGETGLDYYRNLSPRDRQREAFAAQIELAHRLGKPLIVHCRDAFADVHAMLADAGLGSAAVLHCWTGGPRWTRRFRDLGVTFSFAGPVAFETGETVRLGAAEVPPESALVETDTPYLAPPPHRSEPNEPGWVSLVGAALAAVWGKDPLEVAALTSARAAALFGDPR